MLLVLAGAGAPAANGQDSAARLARSAQSAGGPPVVYSDDFRTGMATRRPWKAPAGFLSASARPVRAKREAATGAGRSVAVVLVNFANDRSEPITPEAARQLVFGTSGSVRSLLQEESFGKVNLVGRTRGDGDVVGWLRLSSTNAGCRSDDWSVEALRLWPELSDAVLREFSGVGVGP